MCHRFGAHGIAKKWGLFSSLVLLKPGHHSEQGLFEFIGTKCANLLNGDLLLSVFHGIIALCGSCIRALNDAIN